MAEGNFLAIAQEINRRICANINVMYSRISLERSILTDIAVWSALRYSIEKTIPKNVRDLVDNCFLEELWSRSVPKDTILSIRRFRQECFDIYKKTCPSVSNRYEAKQLCRTCFFQAYQDRKTPYNSAFEDELYTAISDISVFAFDIFRNSSAGPQGRTVPPRSIRIPKKALAVVGCAALVLLAFWGGYSLRSTESAPDKSTSSASGTATISGDYVASANSDKFHFLSCEYAQNIAEENKIYYASQADAKKDGKKPCSVCISGSSHSTTDPDTSQTSQTGKGNGKFNISPQKPDENGFFKYERPETNYIFKESGAERLAPLSIKTHAGCDYCISLQEVGSSSATMKFFVRGGETAEVDVPLGNYEIYYATGTDWYGQFDLFGLDTVYNKCDGTFDFYLDGNYYQGWTLELYLQNNGNMGTEIIDADEFPT